MSELKPCQCGCEAHIGSRTDYQHYATVVWYWVECMCPSCGMTGGADLGKSGAIAKWNTRPIEDKLKAENERLKAENKELNGALDVYLNETLPNMLKTIAEL